MKNKGIISKSLHLLKLKHIFDKGRFFFQKIKNYSNNIEFKNKNPDLKLPPDYIMYESFKLDYERYYNGGRQSAIWLKEIINKYSELKNKNILDWGCGPARIIRHLPDVINNECNFYGTDFNKKTIIWNKANLTNISFHTNKIIPPLSFEPNFFDIIYGISIFTHLSEKNHYLWFDELLRVSKKGGIILLTTAGEAFKEKMTKSEVQSFNANKLVIRGNVIEGHRVFTTFHPPKYLKKLFNNKVDILEFTAGKKETWGINQDIWVLKKL